MGSKIFMFVVQRLVREFKDKDPPPNLMCSLTSQNFSGGKPDAAYRIVGGPSRDTTYLVGAWKEIAQLLLRGGGVGPGAWGIQCQRLQG